MAKTFSELLETTKINLEQLGKATIKGARSNLTKGKHNRTYRLYKSLTYDLIMHKNSLEFGFNMMYYGVFVDKGTSRGIKPTYFFTKPYETNFKKIEDDITEFIGIEIDSFLEYTLDKVFKDINSKKK